MGPAAIAALLFYSGFFAVIFAVPVQFVLARRGNRPGIVTGLILTVLIIAGRVVQVVRYNAAMSRELLTFLALDTLLPLGIVVALILFTVMKPYTTWSVRLLGSALVAVLFALPAVVEVITPEELSDLLSGELGTMLQAMGLPDDAVWFSEQVSRVVKNTLGAAMVSTIAVNWWVGMNFAYLRRGYRAVISLHRAKVEEWLIWPLIAGLGLVVFHWLGGLSDFPAALGWNLTLGTAFVFGIQGVGIIQYLLIKRGVSPSALRWTLTAVAVSLFIPGINIVVIGGLPILGVSELWVNFRRRGTDEGNSES